MAEEVKKAAVAADVAARNTVVTVTGPIVVSEFEKTMADVLGIKEREYDLTLRGKSGNDYTAKALDIQATLAGLPYDASRENEVRTAYPVIYRKRTFVIKVSGGPISGADFGSKLLFKGVVSGTAARTVWSNAVRVELAPAKAQ